jgi:protein-S-isoprenylcysteine O-methyltransferase Ste14
VQASGNVKENIKKARISMFYYLILIPALIMLIAALSLVTGKAQDVEKQVAAQVAIVFALVTIVIDVYSNLTLPDRAGYNKPPGNVWVRFFIRTTEVLSTYYVAGPAVATLLDGLLGLGKLVPAPYNWLGLLPLALGGFLAIWSSVTFSAKGSGTTIPFEPTQNLIIEGPYRYIRNPMMLGTLIVVAGLTLLLASCMLLIFLCMHIVVDTLYVAKVEEKEMEIRFGQAYLDYKARVPSCFPRLRRKQG